MKRTASMFVMSCVLAAPIGCREAPPAKEAKAAPVSAKPAALPPLPLSVLADELELPLKPPATLAKKPAEEKPAVVVAPAAPLPPEENTLRVRLAEKTAQKDRAHYEVAYTQRVFRHVQQHENAFIANWNPSDVEWAGPIEPILQGYRQIKNKCERRLQEQQEEVRRAEADWAQADADLKKHLDTAK